MNAQRALRIVCSFGFTLMVLNACQLTEESDAQSVETSPAVADRVLAVESGLIPSWVIAGVDRDESSWTIEGRMKARAVPGVSVAVINAGRIEWAKGYGEIATGEGPTDAATTFQTASIGKTVTAMTVLALVDRGVLDLDREVNEYLASWRLPAADIAEDEGVTLDRILSHMAGLTVHGFGGYTPGEELPTLRRVCVGDTENGHVVGLGRSGGEDDLLAGSTAEAVRHRLAGRLQGHEGLAARSVAAARGVGVTLVEKGQHCLDHLRIAGRGGVVVEVDDHIQILQRSTYQNAEHLRLGDFGDTIRLRRRREGTARVEAADAAKSPGLMVPDAGRGPGCGHCRKPGRVGRGP